MILARHHHHRTLLALPSRRSPNAQRSFLIRKRISPVVAARIFSDSDILPDFLNTVAAFACPNKDPTCLAKIIVPPPTEQAQILDTFNAIYQMIPDAAHSIHSAVFQLLLTHDIHTLQTLMAEYANYSVASKNIQEILNAIL